MAYFDQFPDLLLPSYTERNSSFDYVRVKNLFKRGKIREDFFESAVVFDKYLVKGDDRPDQVAEKLYNDPYLDWVVLISNNIINVRDEWPMAENDFNSYIREKYPDDLLTQIHHYETKKVTLPNGVTILNEGNWVDASYFFMYSYDGENYTKSGSDILTSKTNYEHELDMNERKRTIYVLKQQYLRSVLEDMRLIMSYTDSSQYIDKRTKKGDNLRILSPR